MDIEPSISNNAEAPIPRAATSEQSLYEDPLLHAGIGSSYAAGPPIDVYHTDLSNLAIGSALHYNTSNFTGESASDEGHLAQFASQAGIGGSYTGGPPTDAYHTDLSNLAIGSALQYNICDCMLQRDGSEGHLAQFASQAAPTASSQSRFTCSHCGKAFKRKGDLTRHGKSHGQTKLHCLYANCLRPYTKGFYRKDKLMDHLESSHKLTKVEARDWANSTITACSW